jgi:hypothetical protein
MAKIKSWVPTGLETKIYYALEGQQYLKKVLHPDSEAMGRAVES